MAREESQETPHLAPRAPQGTGVFRENRGPKDLEEMWDALELKGLLALPDCQGSRVPRAEKVVLGFQGSQAHLAIPVTKALQGLQGLQGSPVLQEAQASQVGKGHEEIWGLLDQLE